MIMRKHIWIMVVVSALLALGTINCTGCKKKTAEPPAAGTYHVHSPAEVPAQTPAESSNPAENTIAKPAETPKISIKDVIAKARWNPVYQSWYGKTAPDFTLTDINGKKHTLSDYRGKDVMLVFWATWCGPCIMEVPHLIAFQTIATREKIEILAISYISYANPANRIEAFARQNPRINYTIFAANKSDMPKPYDYIEYIPCSFFIDPQGKIKVATTGTLSLGDMKLIMQAR